MAVCSCHGLTDGECFEISKSENDAKKPKATRVSLLLIRLASSKNEMEKESLTKDTLFSLGIYHQLVLEHSDLKTFYSKLDEILIGCKELDIYYFGPKDVPILHRDQESLSSFDIDNDVVSYTFDDLREIIGDLITRMHVYDSTLVKVKFINDTKYLPAAPIRGATSIQHSLERKAPLPTNGQTIADLVRGRSPSRWWIEESQTTKQNDGRVDKVPSKNQSATIVQEGAILDSNPKSPNWWKEDEYDEFYNQDKDYTGKISIRKKEKLIVLSQTWGNTTKFNGLDFGDFYTYFIGSYGEKSSQFDSNHQLYGYKVKTIGIPLKMSNKRDVQLLNWFKTLQCTVTPAWTVPLTLPTKEIDEFSEKEVEILSTVETELENMDLIPEVKIQEEKTKQKKRITRHAGSVVGKKQKSPTLTSNIKKKTKAKKKNITLRKILDSPSKIKIPKSVLKDIIGDLRSQARLQLEMADLLSQNIY